MMGKASKKAVQCLHNVIKVNSAAKPLQIMLGTPTREPAHIIHPSLGNLDRLSKFNTQNLDSLSCLSDLTQHVICCDCGVFVCMICYFILNDCVLAFNQADIDVMYERTAPMITNKSCGVIEDPGSTLIITCQNHCDDRLFLY
jgi:hypothetical protein